MNTSRQPTRHLLIIEDRKYRTTLSLQDEVYSIGRNPRNSIVICSQQASRHHGTLMRRKNRMNNEETYWILDGDMNGNKSRNGIYVNGEKCLLKELKQGDLINFGCEVNATFYTMNNWSDTIIPLTDEQQENRTTIQSKLISYSEASSDVRSSQSLNSTKILNPKATLNPRATIQGQSYQEDQESKLFKAKTALQKALEHEEFILYYQPQVNLETGEMSGMEALVRWNHPQLGLIPPYKFIPLAEKTELICSLGEWILKTACSQNFARQNLGLPPITISVNLSPYQLQDPNFVKVLRQILKDTQLDPQWLELEVTEKAFFSNPEIAHRTLLDLKQLGLNLCLDDFGSGSSSLNHLVKFPFDTMKVAQSSVKKLTEDKEQFALISASLTVAKSLKIRAVAEGVETEQQLNILKNLDCQEMQGYLFSKPLKSTEATRFTYRKTRDVQNTCF